MPRAIVDAGGAICKVARWASSCEASHCGGARPGDDCGFTSKAARMSSARTSMRCACGAARTETATEQSASS